MKTELMYTYIERLSNLLKNEQRRVGAKYGLQPVQLEALHYLNLCNRYSDTPKGVTEYLGQTKGTVSQSLKVLEREGYITKHQDLEDKRITHLKVSKEGKQVLMLAIPPELFVNACSSLKEEKQDDIINNLTILLKAIQQSNQLKTFGVCATCRHYMRGEGEEHFCDLTKEKLSKEDAALICLEHEEPQ